MYLNKSCCLTQQYHSLRASVDVGMKDAQQYMQTIDETCSVQEGFAIILKSKIGLKLNRIIAESLENYIANCYNQYIFYFRIPRVLNDEDN